MSPVVTAKRAPLDAMRDMTFVRSGFVPSEFRTSAQSPKTANENDWLEPAGIWE